MNKTIKEFTDVELKATAYDCLARIEQNQSLLQEINKELKLRNDTPKEAITPDREGTPENTK